MPRDINGNFTLTAGNPVVADTIIEAAWANTTMPDIASAMSDSLSRTGQGSMLVPFRNLSGTKAAPGMTWSAEPSSGWYRKALNDFWYSVGNEDIFQITKTGVALAVGKTATGFGSTGTSSNLLAFCSPAKVASILAGTQTDVTTELQACIDSVCPVSGSNLTAGTVILPDKSKLLTTVRVNCTNSRQAGTLIRDGLCIKGNGVILTGQTGAGNAVIETTGSQWLTIERGIMIDSTLCPTMAAASTIGVGQYVGSVLFQTQNQLIACRINMHSAPTANTGVGTVACWNFGAEECTYGEIYWQADCGIVLTFYNNGQQPGPHTLQSYQALTTNHSLGLTTFRGECAIINVSRSNAPLLIQGASGVKSDNLYMAYNAGTTGANVYAMKLLGTNSCLDMKIHVEGFSALNISGIIQTSRLEIIQGGVSDPLDPNTPGVPDWTHYPVIGLDRNIAGVQGILCDFVVDRQSLNHVAAPGAPILSTSDGDEVTATTANLQSCTIKARALGAAFLYMPANIAVNSNSVAMYGSSYGAVSDPTFAVGLSTDMASVTGDGTIVDLSVPWQGGGSFSRSTYLQSNVGHFVSPENLDYQFHIQVMCYNIAANHVIGQLWLVTGDGQQYLIDQKHMYNASVDIGAVRYTLLSGSAIIYIPAGSYVKVRASVGGGSKIVTFRAGGTGTDWVTRAQGRSIRPI